MRSAWWWLALLGGCTGELPAEEPTPPFESSAESEALGAAPVPAPPAPTCPPLPRWLPAIPTGEADLPLVSVTDAEILAPFFERVARLARGLATDHVRVAVYGDSNLTMDHLTGRMRRTLQQHYGDAGHGFVALGRPWSHYLHMDVRHDARGFEAYAVSTHPSSDGGYGISGISAESAYTGAKSWVATAREGAPVGTSASRFGVFYLTGPNWGTFDIVVDNDARTEVSATAAEAGVGHHPFELEDAPHHIAFVASDARHRVRLLGATLERGEPSFVIDSFGVGAMNTASQAREDPKVNAPMLATRGYDLIVFATGANDVFTLDVTPGHLHNIIASHRAALPNAPILMMTPADRGKERTFAPTLKAIEQRRAVAKAEGAALWDLFEAMGGRNSMRTFKGRGFAMSDYIHFNEAGGGYLGDRLVYALWSALWSYVDAHPDAGCVLPRSADSKKE